MSNLPVKTRHNGSDPHALCRRRKEDIASMLAHIGDAVTAFGEDGRLGWGHAGTLGHLRELMVEATAFITGLGESEVLDSLEDANAGQ
jgi:hypothetical protein